MSLISLNKRQIKIWLRQNKPFLYFVNLQINQLSIVPPLAIFIAKSPLVAQYDLRSVMSVGCGAAPLAKDTQDEACRKLGVQQFGQGKQPRLSYFVLD